MKFRRFLKLHGEFQQLNSMSDNTARSLAGKLWLDYNQRNHVADLLSTEADDWLFDLYMEKNDASSFDAD